MAEVLNDFDFIRRPRAATYPWYTWFDGQIWKLRRGKDFDALLLSFQAAAYAAARRHGLILHTRVLPDEDAIVLQAQHK